MYFTNLSAFLRLNFITFVLVTLFSISSNSASFVLGKQYLLKPKRQLSSLVWYAVTFDKSIAGGLKVSLKVFSEKGKNLEFLDNFRDYVAPEIAERCISKFSMTNYRMDFNEQKRSELEFQTNSIGDVIYIPLKVKYEDGFEDYLVRIRIKGGKFAISTRPLQHGMLTRPEDNAIENYRADQLKQKENLKKQEEDRKAKLEAEKKKEEERLKAQQEEMIKNAPAVNINDELFNPEEEVLEQLLKETESKFNEKEQEAKGKIKTVDEDLYSQPLQTPTEVLSPSTDTTPTIQNQAPTDSSSTPDSSGADDELDNFFNGGAGATKTETDIKSQGNLNPFDSNLESIPMEDSKKTKEKSKNTKPVPTNSIDDDDEIEIEGFDKALEEIERLESLEKNE